VWSLVEDGDSDFAGPLRALFAEACLEIRDIERRLEMVEGQLIALARQTPAVDRLMKVPGIGLLTATALVGLVGDFRRFPSGRHFASYLGLTPREHSSGLRRHLGRISKRGDVYLRALFTHGARSLLRAAQLDATTDGLRAWAVALTQRAHRNKTAVALANRMARIAWAVSVKDTDYHAWPMPRKVA
jgi:transposase